jgi:hypothetical protein
MEPTDEMVEAVATIIFDDKDGLDLGLDWPEDFLPDHQTQVREMLSLALRAALAVMPDRYREGWIAGRDAAAKIAHGAGHEGLATEIFAMEPPQ